MIRKPLFLIQKFAYLIMILFFIFLCELTHFFLKIIILIVKIVRINKFIVVCA